MSNEQFALRFLDTTSLAGGLGLYSGSSAPKASPPAAIDLEPEADEAPAAADPALDYRFAGDRKLAQGWKARAAGQSRCHQPRDPDRSGGPPRPAGPRRLSPRPARHSP